MPESSVLLGDPGTLRPSSCGSKAESAEQIEQEHDQQDDADPAAAIAVIVPLITEVIPSPHGSTQQDNGDRQGLQYLNLLRSCGPLAGVRRHSGSGASLYSLLVRTRLSFAVTLMLAAALPSAQGPLTLVRSIELPDVDGRLDHLGFDAAHQRLYVAGLGNNTVEVLDLNSNTHLRSLPGFREPQGIGVAADAKVIAIANGEGDGVQLIDANDVRSIRSVSLGDDSDNVRYDPVAQLFYVGYGSGALAVFRPSDGTVTERIRLPAHPESFQLERNGRRIFVNVPDANHIVVIDRSRMTVVATWPVKMAGANFPMALDEANHRLFIGCRRPAKVLIYDTSNGQVNGSFDIVGDTDDLFYDIARKRLYVTGGGGFVDAFEQQPAGSFTRIAHLPTAAGARTSLFVPDQSRLYIVVPHRGRQRAEVRVYEVSP